MSTRIGIECAFRASQAHRRELIQTLEGMQQRMRESDPTCECKLYEDLGEANRYLWVEWWPGRDRCAAERSSDRFRALLGAVKVLGRLESMRSLEQSALEPLHNEKERHDGRPALGLPHGGRTS